jgi:asparagine synthase (glutamine-hydrolysing)
MCGIAGIWNWDQGPVDIEDLVVMTRMLAHRGPDAEGFALLQDGCLGLGHRRLAVLDLKDSGRQPMSISKAPLWIVYNGEIYNFLELRDELVGKGHNFVTDTDTEVILAAYAEWGLDCLPRFNGMFAFAIWDKNTRRLIVVRDRYGVKPLHYFHDGRRFAFASEQKAFLHLRDFCPSEDTFAFGEKMWKGIDTLPPGHLLVVEQNRVQCKRWWEPRKHWPQVPRAYNDQVDQFRDLLLDACRIRMRSDVPLATSVSGGIDSSAVLCALSWLDKHCTRKQLERRPDNWQRAFHAWWPGTWQDEQRFAEMAVKQSGADPVWYDGLSKDSISLESFQDYLFQSEMFGLFGWGPWLLYRAMRAAGIVVTLDGQGADELLGGYNRHIEHALLNSPGYLSNPLRTFELAKAWHGLAPRRSLLKSLAAGSPLCRNAYYRLFRKPWRAAKEKIVADLEKSLHPGEIDDLDLMGKMQYLEVHCGYLPLLNLGYDLHSMSHAIETRLPFEDWRLVNFSLALPDSTRIGRGYSKRILRDAAKDLVPAEILQRKKKIGFNAPIFDILKRSDDIRGWFSTQLGDPELRSVEPRMAQLAERHNGRPWASWPTDDLNVVVGAWYKTKWASDGARRAVSRDIDQSVVLRD